MSSPTGHLSGLGSLIGADPDYKSVNLVAKINEKTRAGRIVWKKSPTGFIASVPGGLELGFVPAGPEVLSSTWGTFTVRDRGGNEILKVENPAAPIIRLTLSALLTSPSGSLVAAIGELYDQVRGIASSNIDKAIDLLDKV